MKIALELSRTEYQVLLDCLDEKIQRFEEYKDTHEEDWDAMDEEELQYKHKLRDKIQEFCEWQALLDKEED